MIPTCGVNSRPILAQPDLLIMYTIRCREKSEPPPFPPAAIKRNPKHLDRVPLWEGRPKPLKARYPPGWRALGAAWGSADLGPGVQVRRTQGSTTLRFFCIAPCNHGKHDSPDSARLQEYPLSCFDRRSNCAARCPLWQRCLCLSPHCRSGCGG